MSQSTLVSLAILKVNWDQLGVDYVENYVPFIVECARLTGHDVISLPEMQSSVAQRFGLSLPQNAIKMIISRAIKRGYFRRESGVVYKNSEKCGELDFRQAQDAVGATYSRVLTTLRKYARKNHGKEWSIEETDAAITDFLANSSLSLLFDMAEGRRGEAKSEGSRFVVASCVEHAQSSDPGFIDDIVLLAKGNLLFNAMYLPDQGKIAKRFKGTSVYFDTAFLMFATGFAGPDRAAPCLELLDLLSQYGADLRCFSNTRNELQGVLDACAARLRAGQTHDSYGTVMEYFIQAGKTASDLEFMAARLPGKLKRLGVKVVDLPSHAEYEFQIDEKGFEEQLSNDLNYSNPNARVHDVDCISAIARLRRGRQSRDVEECKAIFVTTNLALARSTRRFFQGDAAPGAVALAVTDYAVANLLWLKNPMAAPDLPRKRLLADVYAAMQPSPNLWRKYLTEIAKLEDSGKVSADEYLLLRHSLSAKAALMDLTEGIEAAFTEGTVQEVLEVAKENVRADLRRELELQQRRRLQAEEELQAAGEVTLAQRRRFRRIGRSVARYTSRAVLVVAGVATTYGVVITFPWEFPALPEAWATYLTSGILFLLTLMTVGNLVFGTTLRSLVDRLENALANGLEAALLKIAGLPAGTQGEGPTIARHYASQDASEQAEHASS